MPRSSRRSKLMVRTSVTVPFEPTGAAKPQGDRPKSARSTNPQYQCGFRANREETKHRSRDALHRPPSWAYSIENTGITGERSPFRQAPRVTPSALQSDFARNAVAPPAWQLFPQRRAARRGVRRRFGRTGVAPATQRRMTATRFAPFPHNSTTPGLSIGAAFSSGDQRVTELSGSDRHAGRSGLRERAASRIMRVLAESYVRPA